MASRRRPTALDMWDGEGQSAPRPSSRASNSRPLSDRDTLLKRASEGPDDGAMVRGENGKRPRRAEVAFYEPPSAYKEEVEIDVVLEGEDEEEADEGEAKKPFRIITDLSVFDPNHRQEMIPLSSMDGDDRQDRRYEATGFVRAYTSDDNHDGDSEDGDEEDDKRKGLFVRLRAILHYAIDFTQQADPVWIETQFAWYSLEAPSDQYLPFFRDFYGPRFVVQHLFSWILRHPRKFEAYEEYIEDLENTVDCFGKTLGKSDLKDAIPYMREALSEVKNKEYSTLRSSALLKGILKMGEGQDSRAPSRSTGLQASRSVPTQLLRHRIIRDPDSWALKVGNQQRTHVTPCIASLARPLVDESMQVVGKRSKSPDPNGIPRGQRRFLKELIRRGRKPVEWVKLDWKGKVGSDLAQCFIVDGSEYHVGDVVLMRNENPFWLNPGNYNAPVHDLPANATIANYFWFGQVHYIHRTAKWAHIQWLEHGAGRLIAELAVPQELYLSHMMCDNVSWNQILGKVKVHWNIDRKTVAKATKEYEFFCNLAYDHTNVSWVSLPSDPALFNTMPEQDRCLSCHRRTLQENKTECRQIKAIDGAMRGFEHREKTYHLYDFVLYMGDQGCPAKIGHIQQINLKSSNRRDTAGHVKVRKVGRIVDLPLQMTPKDKLRDERELFMTEENDKVSMDDLIGVVFVLSERDMPKERVELESWVEASPLHFYIKSQFSSLHPTSWKNRIKANFRGCGDCLKDKRSEMELLREFRADMEEHALPTLDLFGGVGAFSRGIAEGSGFALNVKYAVELSPSAAQSLRRNSPDTIVYNQCANAVLRQAIKVHAGHSVTPLPEIWEHKKMCPPPPPKDDVKVIVAGFPCQSHSAMNKYAQANDRRNNLIFNLLSWIDHYRPEFAFLENVPNFMNTRLKGIQATENRVEGGIEKGNLKILVKALLTLGYQVRFALMQAAHYGTPQDRRRFILVAARQGTPLPDLPQPSHSLAINPVERPFVSLTVKLPYGYDMPSEANPIRKNPCAAPHHSTTVWDSIGDLPRFRWKLPKSNPPPREIDGKRVLTLSCRYKEGKTCGISGPNPEYHYAPRTRLQYEARKQKTDDIQHATRILPPKTTRRVIALPIQAGADSRSLPPQMQEWQTVNSASANARNNYRAGNYGRLHFDKPFNTVVTNVGPTAKQSQIIHPDSERIVSFRELARAQGFSDDFVFVSIKGNASAIYNQIGNAVPWQLGRALGRELRMVLLQRWKRERNRRRTTSDVEMRVEEREVVNIDSDSDCDSMYVTE